MTDDMRRQIVLREINQGALAGLQSEITEQAADLVLTALDRYDTWAANKGSSADARLGRIAQAHSKDVGEGGLTSGLCVECDLPHPCPTYSWATTDRDPLATWDPADDEPQP
ncbi:hypothetical protein ABZ636_03760 [Streptomyces sp. NPDC007251]|uniref:hypothetical protein n=1 Tax=Streptomyces sp. NPDC007251 TaxID=3154483 RepID=UPI0033C861EF